MTNRTQVIPRVLVTVLALWTAACAPGVEVPDAGETIPDAGSEVDAGTPPTARFLRAHTNDGTVLHAYFSEPVAPSPADISFKAGELVQVATVSSVTPDANDAKHVVITLATALPKGPEYTVVIDRVVRPDRNSQSLRGTLHVAMVWHQHQPSYVDPVGDYLRGPWVRKHGTKSYYDMTAMLGDHPDIHVMVNLTPILLMQLEEYYLARLQPFVDTTANTVDETGYFAQPHGDGAPVTDPWIDQLLRDTPAPNAISEAEKGWFYADAWSTFSVSDVIIDRWPAYKALRTKKDTAPATLTQDDLLQMKGYFQLAWFDPDFLKGRVDLPDGSFVDLSDLVTYANDTYTLVRPFTEADCNRLVAEEYKVLANIVGIHKARIYDATAKTGQVEVMTTPYFHPILPLVTDSDLAKDALPNTPMPQGRFQQREDAEFHVKRAAATFQARFGKPVTGMWPAEGSVAEAVNGLFSDAGVKWIASDRLVLSRSTPTDQPNVTPYRIDVDTVTGDDGNTGDELAIVFRDTTISDKVGFQYQGGTPEENVVDFMDSLRRQFGPWGKDRLLTIILDGENAWEWYRKDNDAKGTLHGIYDALTTAQVVDEVRTVTVSEYLSGNAARKVDAHPVHALPELEPLHAGSWIGGSYATWIGEDEENLAWDYLKKVRDDLTGFAQRGLTRPAHTAAEPTRNTPQWHAWKAWMAMYAAEGSDWFWWYGSDQTAGGGDEPFDRIFLELLKSVYRHAAAAGITTDVPDLVPILRYCQYPTAAMTGTPTIDGAIDPSDDGDLTQPSEWTTAGAGACVDPDGTVASALGDVIQSFHHGTTADTLYLALRWNAGHPLTGDKVRLYASQKHIESLGPPVVTTQDPKLAVTRDGQPIVMNAGGAARELTILKGEETLDVTLATVVDEAWAEPAVSPGISAAWTNEALELAIPLSTLGWVAGDPLEFVAVLETVIEDGEVDRIPNVNAITLFPDRSTLVELTFVLDATGNRLPLTEWKSIDNKPPPAGTGKAFIVGSLPELGNWTPNTIVMSDDGVTHGDEAANDNFWTFRFSVPPQTLVNYKYTIGNAGDGWGPSEEYPLTNRGFEAKDLNGDSKMVIRDVFADRPEPSGVLPELTQVTNP